MKRSGIRTIGFILLGMLFSVVSWESPLMAAGKTTGNSAKTSKKRKKPKDSEGQPSDSSAGGDEASYGATGAKSQKSRKEVLGNVGLSPSPLLGFGITGGLIRPDNSGLEADLTYASGTSGTIAAKITHIGGRYRVPIMKIGYVAGGAGLRMASGSWTVLSTDATNEYPASSSFNAITLDGAIGAATQLGSFIVGADLLGISFPLFKMGAKTTEPDATDLDTADADAQKAKFNKLAGGMTMTLLKVGVGIYF